MAGVLVSCAQCCCAELPVDPTTGHAYCSATAEHVVAVQATLPADPLPACTTRVSLVMDQLLRLMHHCGMPTTDVDLLHGSGLVMNHVIREAQPRNVLFTGEGRPLGKCLTATPACCQSAAVCHILGHMQHVAACTWSQSAPAAGELLLLVGAIASNVLPAVESRPPE